MATPDTLKAQLTDKPQRRTIRDLIEEQRVEIERALPKAMDPDRFTRVVLTTVRSTPELQECEPVSLIAAMMLSAQVGLEPGPLGHCYLIPRRIKGVKQVMWMLGYRGIIELAHRSPAIESIEAREVHERDHFEFAYGLADELTHRPVLGDRGPLVAVYGLARFAGGGHYFRVMSRTDIDGIRERSDAAERGPWVTDYEAMARKTVIRAMAPFLPLTVEAASAIAADESTPTEIGEHMVDDVIDVDVIDEGGE